MTTSATDQIKEQFIRAHLDGEPVTLKELARIHSRSHDGLRQVASKDQWTKKATLACADRDNVVATKMRQQNAVTACVLEQSIGREIDVRLRHVSIARSLQRLALESLM